MPTLNITPRQRSALRAAAHALKPVVQIGDKGLTEAVIKEINVHLNAHQLIKIRIAGDDREFRLSTLTTICERLEAAPVHHLGKILTIYRRNPSLDPVLPDDLPRTRALRKPNEEYIPKKQAAADQGKPTKSARSSRPTAPARPARPNSTASRAARPRTGSALSLRAGARRTRAK